MSRNVVNHPGPCWYFRQGKCNRGNNCRFLHADETPVNISTYHESRTYPEPLDTPVIDPASPLQATENNNPTRGAPPRWRRGRANYSAKGKGKAPVRPQDVDSATEGGSGAGFVAASAEASSSWRPSGKRYVHGNAASVSAGHGMGQMNTLVQSLEEIKNIHPSVSHPLYDTVKL